MDKMREVITKAKDIRDGRYGTHTFSEMNDWLHHDLDQLSLAIEDLNSELAAKDEYIAELERAAGLAGKGAA